MPQVPQEVRAARQAMSDLTPSMFTELVSLCHTEEGTYIASPSGNPWTRAMWLALRQAADAYFETQPDEQIAQMRQEFRERDSRLVHESTPLTPSKPQAHKPGYIYLLHGEGTNWYKIGISAQLTRRVKVIGSKSPFPIVRVAAYDVEDMKDAEAWWHETFAHKRTHGEWFALDEYDILLFDAQEGRPIL